MFIEESLWEDYQSDSSLRARNALIELYWPVVGKTAKRLARKLNFAVPVDDLEAYGSVGLIEAIERFDVDRGVPFEAFAVIRIRGAMIDELRALDWVPRSVRTFMKSMDVASQELAAELYRDPSLSEIADKLGMSSNQLCRQMVDLQRTRTMSLDAPVGRDGDVTFADLVAGYDPNEETIEGSERSDLMAELITELSDRERVILTLAYYEGLTFSDIALILGIKSESRISQIHSKALEEVARMATERGL